MQAFTAPHRYWFTVLDETGTLINSQPLSACATFETQSGGGTQTGLPTPSATYGFRDDTAHLRYIGVWKVWDDHIDYSNMSSTEPVPVLYSTTYKARFKEVFAFIKNVDHSNGNIVWGDVNQNSDYLVWREGSGFSPIQTSSTILPQHNNWAMQTGNGMIYNSNYIPVCPLTVNISTTDAECSNTTGKIIIYVSGSSTWDTFGSTATMWIDFLSPGVYEYRSTPNSNSDQFNITSILNTSTISSYTILGVPPGTYQFFGTTSYVNGGCNLGPLNATVGV